MGEHFHRSQTNELMIPVVMLMDPSCLPPYHSSVFLWCGMERGSLCGLEESLLSELSQEWMSYRRKRGLREEIKWGKAKMSNSVKEFQAHGVGKIEEMVETSRVTSMLFHVLSVVGVAIAAAIADEFVIVVPFEIE